MNKTNQTNKSRNAIAAVIAVALLATGTFAWQSFDQEALNESIIKGGLPGARLHDDFKGVDKDVFVENYMSEEEGGEATFVRVRLDEYMEIGVDAGIHEENADLTGDRKVQVYRGDISNIMPTEEPHITDETTWDTFVLHSGSDGNVNVQGSSYRIRDYRDLKLAGQGSTKTYLPTFNKNSASEEAQVNGTIEGLDGLISTPADAYSDYLAPVTTVGDAEYYIEAGTEETQLPEHLKEDGETLYELSYNFGDAFYKVVDVTHEPQEAIVPTKDVISMKDWLDLEEDQQTGAYWVYDADGWAYWAQPLMPQEATAVLLDEIETISDMRGVPYYYAVYVTGHFATLEDLGKKNAETEEEKGFYADITTNGETLLNKLVEASKVQP